MFFDAQKMRWFKVGRNSLGGASANGGPGAQQSDPRSPYEEDDEEDPFAGLEDLKVESADAKTNASGAPGPFSSTSNTGAGNGATTFTNPFGEDAKFEDPSSGAFVGEEFDLGPSFIRRQREEEAVWRRRVEGWVGGVVRSGEESERREREAWRWAVRDLAAHAFAEVVARR